MLILFGEADQLTEIFTQRRDIAVNHSDRIIDFVSDAGSKMPQRGHSLGLQKQRLHFLQLIKAGLQVSITLVQFARSGMYLFFQLLIQLLRFLLSGLSPLHLRLHRR